MKSHARVVIVGGGVVGCAAAWHLVRAGCSDVLLLERADLTSGSTWHAAANVHAMHTNTSLARLQDYSLRLYDSLEEETGQSCGLHRCGGLYLATSTDRLDELKIQRARARYLGQEFEIIGPDDIRKLNPLVDTSRILGGMWGATDGHVDPSGVTHAFARGVRQAGGVIARSTPVTGFTRRRDGDWDVATPAGTVVAETVVNAAGLWAREVAAMAGYTLPLVPMEHQYVVTDDIAEVAALEGEIPLTRDQDSEFYLRQEGKGMLLGCYEREGVHWAVDGTPEDFGMELLPDDIDRISANMEAAISIVPCLGSAGVKRVVNGPMMWSPDGAALVGPVPGKQGHFVAAGMIPGFSQSAGVGWALADWILEGVPPLDMMPLDVTRYGDWADQTFVLARSAETYSKRFAIGWPEEERESGRPVRTSPVHDLMAGNGAVFGAAFGLERPLWFADPGEEARDIPSFRRPNWFTAVGRECRALRRAVGMIEITGFARYEVEGPDATAFLDHLLACRLPRKHGRTVLAPMLNAAGGIIGDFTVTRLSDTAFWLVGSGAAEAFHLRHFAQFLPHHDVALRSITGDYGGFAIAGPNARALLGKLTQDDVSNAAFPFLAARHMEIAGIPAFVMRIAFTGDLGYEIHVGRDNLKALYCALTAAGTDVDLVACGARALDSLRLEKGYGRWGAEFTADTTPFEAGLGRFVAMDKGDFIGRDALLKAHNQGPRYRLCTLLVDADDADAWGNEPVLMNGGVVGTVSSGGFGHHVGHSIALAYLDPGIDLVSSSLHVEILGEPRRARLAPEAPFDPDNTRLLG